MNGFPFSPGQASTFAGPVDTLFFILLALAGAITAGVCLTMVYFLVKYHRGSRASRVHPTSSNLRLELTWTIVPLLLSFGVFFYGARLYFDMYRPPARAIEIQVVGKQWMWKFQHPEGQQEIDELHVPVGQPIRLNMISQDVIHSFFVPAFRVKQDVLPGRYTTAWFQATQVGSYHLFCTQYCGTDHAVMGGQVIVLSQADYQQWLANTSGGQTLAQQGADLFRAYGCSGCHLMDGSGVGPSLIGVYGRPVHLADGTTVIADDKYVRDSILLPESQVVAGYRPVMPSFQGILDEGEVLQLIDYVKSLGAPQQPGQPAPTVPAPGGQP
jgi:cytochrome c oxidase subunit II